MQRKVRVCVGDDVKEGVFHAWGVDFEEFDQGPGNFSTAIVEYEDGTVGNVYVDNVTFITNDIQQAVDKVLKDAKL